MKPTETPSHMLQGYPAQSNQQSVYTKKIKKMAAAVETKRNLNNRREKQKPDLSGFCCLFEWCICKREGVTRMDAFEQLIGSLFTKPHDGKEQAHEKAEMDLTDKANDLEEHLKAFGVKMEAFAKETEAFMVRHREADYIFKQQK